MSQAKATETKPVETTQTPVLEEDPSVGRIQVSAQRRKRFYVYVARRQFATREEIQKVVITALGGAIASAISTAGELEQMGVGKIAEVKTSYSPIDPEAQGRSVARIAIIVARNPDWKPDETDAPRRPTRFRKEEAEEGAAKDKEVKEEPKPSVEQSSK